MEDQNILLFLDKLKKNLELGMVPQTISAIEVLETELTRNIAKKKGVQIVPITIPEPTETEKANPIFMRDFEIAGKSNEIIHFINQRFPVG